MNLIKPETDDAITKREARSETTNISYKRSDKYWYNKKLFNLPHAVVTECTSFVANATKLNYMLVHTEILYCYTIFYWFCKTYGLFFLFVALCGVLFLVSDISLGYYFPLSMNLELI